MEDGYKINRAVRLGLLCLFFVGIVSCREYFPTSPAIAREVNVTTSELDSLYNATENVPLAVGFDVIILDLNGLPIAGVPINVELIADEGSIAIPENSSNDDGVVHALYYNHKPLLDYQVHLQIMADGDTLIKMFEVKVRPQPAAIIPMPEHQILTVNANKNIEACVTFRVINSKGIPVPYADVGFRLISGIAAIESVAYSDINGIVKAYLNLTPIENSGIVVQAELRFVELKPNMESNRLVSLNIIKNIPQPKEIANSRNINAISTINVIVE